MLLLVLLQLPVLQSTALDQLRQAVAKFRELEEASHHLCGFERVSAASLDEATFGKLVSSRDRPLLIYGVDSRGTLQADTSKEKLLETYGEYEVQVESGIDFSRGHFKLGKHTTSLQNYMLSPTGNSEIVYESGLEGKFSQKVWQSKKDFLPHFLQNFSAQPVVSFGTLASGAAMRRQEDTWLLSLQGRKVWVVSDVGVTPSGDPWHFGKASPCRHLEASLPAGFRSCVQQPGEIVFLPKTPWHATCNIDDIVFGIGAHGQTINWPSLMNHVVRGNAKALKLELDFLRSRPWRFKHPRPVVAAALDCALSLGKADLAELIGQYAPEVLTWKSAARNDTLDNMSTTSMVHAAVKAGNEKLVRDFMSYGLSPLEPYSRTDDMSPFEAAAMRGHTNIMEVLAKAESDVKGFDGSVEFKAAAFYAAASGHLSVLKLLKSMGVDLRGPGSRHRWPLHGAAAGGKLVTAKALAGKQAVHVQATDADGNTALHAAAEHGHVELVAFLLEHGAAVDTPNGEAMQPLHLAALHGRDQVVEHLLVQRADVHARGQSGSTALHFAADAGALGVVETLLERGASIAAIESSNGMQPLHAAAHGGCKFVVDRLIASNAEVHASLNDGKQAVHLAARKGHVFLTDFFLTASTKDTPADSLLELGIEAGSAGHVRILKWLKDKGMDLSSKGPEHVSPLDLALRQGHVEVAKFFGLRAPDGQDHGEL